MYIQTNSQADVHVQDPPDGDTHLFLAAWTKQRCDFF